MLSVWTGCCHVCLDRMFSFCLFGQDVVFVQDVVMLSVCRTGSAEWVFGLEVSAG